MVLDRNQNLIFKLNEKNEAKDASQAIVLNPGDILRIGRKF